MRCKHKYQFNVVETPCIALITKLLIRISSVFDSSDKSALKISKSFAINVRGVSTKLRGFKTSLVIIILYQSTLEIKPSLCHLSVFLTNPI